MNQSGLENLIWLGSYKTDKTEYKGIPCVPLISMDNETRGAFEKTFQTNVKITERASTSTGTLKVVVEFSELGGNYPVRHNCASLESWFPTPEEFPHQIGDIIRTEITRKYLKTELDANKEVIGLKDGQYDNHFIHTINWSNWQLVEGQPHSQEQQTVQPQLAEVVKDDYTPKEQADIFKEINPTNNDSTQKPYKPQVVKVTDERQADRDARNNNSSDAIAGNIITELWKAGRFPQMLNYTDIVHVGEQVRTLSKIIQGQDTETVKKEYNEFIQKVMGMEDWLEHGFDRGKKK